MHSDTEGVIRYTTDGNEPTEASAAYSEPILVEAGKTLKARTYPTYSQYIEPSDVYVSELPIPPMEIQIGTILQDKSIVVYDRGIQYGDYVIADGYPIRISEGIDDGSYNNQNWRFLILCDVNRTKDLYGYIRSSSKPLQDISYPADFGYGYINSQNCRNTDPDYSLWPQIDEIINTTNKQWFVPSDDEFISSFDNFANFVGDDIYGTSTIQSSSWHSTRFHKVNGKCEIYDSQYYSDYHIVLFRRI